MSSTKTALSALAPTYLSEPQVQYLSQLIQEVRRGNLLIPKFQREFIWKTDQRLELLRSVKEGIPIGSFLVWRTSQVELKTFPTLGGFTMPPPPQPTPGAPRQYLLDGHQRLSTLFGALNSGSFSKPTPTAEDPQPEQAERYYYDLDQEDFFIENRDKLDVRLPTNILLDSIALLKFQRGLTNNDLIERADRVSNVFRNYKIPIVPLVTDNLEDATKAFQRINSSGTPMSDFHMVAALTYSNDFDLPALMAEAQERLAEVGWESLDDKYILATIRAHQKLSVVSPSADAISKVLKKHPGLVEEAALNLRKVAILLKEQCRLLSPQLLPYSYQAVVLAEAFKHTPDPSPAAREKLVKWFWETTYTAYFLGARDKDVNNALRDIRDLSQGRGPREIKPSSQTIAAAPTRYDFRNARGKALLLRLADLKPRSIDGEAFDAGKCLANHGPAAAVQILTSGGNTSAAFSGPENRFIVHPEKAHRFREYMLHDPGSPDDAFLNSHALDKEAITALRRKEYQTFLTRRRHLLLDLESKFVEHLGLNYSSLA